MEIMTTIGDVLSFEEADVSPLKLTKICLTNHTSLEKQRLFNVYFHRKSITLFILVELEIYVEKATRIETVIRHL